MAHFICQVHINHWLLSLSKPEHAIMWACVRKEKAVVPAARRSSKMTRETLVGGHKASTTTTPWPGVPVCFLTELKFNSIRKIQNKPDVVKYASNPSTLEMETEEGRSL